MNRTLTDRIRRHIRQRVETAVVTTLAAVLNRHRRHVLTTNDVDRLAALAQLADHVDDTLDRSVGACLSGGHHWHSIGDQIGPGRLAYYRSYPRTGARR
ncbi:hypothetical protein Ae168Ps1_3494c [Pseudonocardia sp. Ae168_Ps1]|uniref:hypothetical protein n=1 Tax=unclassified Pseudonocardia TaxID=2619320 RepID=UPI00094AFBBE|nr:MULTISPECIES: hypothetical protein [unclassified Pseudonocardia]OLL75093.1 hypothetical protein Ae150APs1_3471c [Pseudonocardia sp. Ae150A_Ps1]OLL81088.1 hypothetical protein Ae168Ps1_3494c [Pseudonocardia sp. Ae168_Ps1]OLL84797.1 hypothetical protein Ae263Ps1_1852 [Pseudonocardia sp. Ae263_Ps1]OLL95186.1 hypothetical protein Ae356Ps1_5083c [Pseudonocardia sp. Ae356_Ps1]